MPVTVEKQPHSREFRKTFQNYSVIEKYKITGAATEQEAIEADDLPIIGQEYLTDQRLRCNSISVVMNGNVPTKWLATVEYSYNALRPVVPKAGDEVFSFDTSNQTMKKYKAISQNKFGDTAQDVGELIGVTSEGEVEGVDIDATIGNMTITTWKYTKDLSAYIRTIFLYCANRVNTVAFYGFQPGEVLFKNARIISIGATSGDNIDRITEIELYFSVLANESVASLPSYTDIEGTAIPYTGITEKKGHQYMWVQEAEKIEEEAIEYATRGVYIAKVYEESDFSLLGLKGKI